MPSDSPAILLAGSRGLDFLNSIATPVDTVVDWIDSGQGLLSWLSQAELVPTEVLNALRKQVLPGELDNVADQARKLREWFRGFVHEHRGKSLEAAHLRELQPLIRLLERDEAFLRIAPSQRKRKTPFELQRTRRWRTPESLLLPIGEALVELVCTTDFADVKACEGHVCTLLFIDRARGKARRWCSMAICGNRAKQAAHRLRTRDS
jgi:predicted RNA-binding Zn ribbon-like protein